MSKKIDDNEIVKALECCSKPYCKDKKCPLYNKGTVNTKDCIGQLTSNALDLINRQKAEIERLEGNLKFVRGTVERIRVENKILSENADTAFQDGLNEAQDLYRQQIKEEIKTEAIKEFAERVETVICENTYPSFDKDGKAVNVWKAKAGYDAIDNLVKEMVGEDE